MVYLIIKGEKVNIGILVFSSTGYTLKFAEAIAAGLEKSGHDIELTRIETDIEANEGPPSAESEYNITNLPDCSKYDIVFIGGPVWAFSACHVVLKAIEQLKGVEDKIVFPFLTMAFPFRFMGGNRAIRMIKKRIAENNGKPENGYIVCRMAHDFDKSVNKQVKRILSDIHSDFQ